MPRSVTSAMLKNAIGQPLKMKRMPSAAATEAPGAAAHMTIQAPANC